MRRWMTVMILTCAIALLLMRLIYGTGDDFESLAGNGTIQIDAPIKASVEVVIQAPVEKVWNLLTGVNDWPKWQTAIKEAHIDGPVASGTTFLWSAGSARIHSKLALVVPNAQLAWTGKAWTASAIHVWKLERLPGDRTRVSTDESMSGFLLTSFYSSRELQVSDQFWLDRLKQEAER
jgi:uncharacterized protein YndB with AHSA1/START domain